MDIKDYSQRTFSLGAEDFEGFKALALQAFYYQRERCKTYREYLELIGKEQLQPTELEQIPFLPIELFKSRDVLTELGERGSAKPQIFTSSATTGMIPSRHIVQDITLYTESFKRGWSRIYGAPCSYNLLALLPSYLEREGSSLVYMAEHLIADVKACGGEGGFYLYNHKELLDKLLWLEGVCDGSSNRKTLLLGVSFALLNFAEFVKEQIPQSEQRQKLFGKAVIIETGGMKGRGRELTREELHSAISEAFTGAAIHSEYGMAELLSQAYSTNGRSFEPSPWMRVLLRDLQDPFRILPCAESGSVGGINIIDLANIGSCCFIETQDRGRITATTHFTVDGRIKNAELRGCNMLLDS